MCNSQDPNTIIDLLIHLLAHFSSTCLGLFPFCWIGSGLYVTHSFFLSYNSVFDRVCKILNADVTHFFRYSSCCWISLNSGGSSWSLSTTVNLTRRADTGQINSSPVSASIPIVRVQKGCSQVIRIPMEDPDGDVVRCRWATGSNECSGICHAFKHADLDEVQRNRKRHNSLHHTTAATSTNSFLFSSNSFVTLFSIKLKW